MKGRFRCSSRLHAKSEPPESGWRMHKAGLSFLVAAVLCAGVRLGVTQDTPKLGAQISLGTVSGSPKGEVMVPLLLAPDSPGTKVGGLEATVVFDTKSVAFERAEKGFLLDGVGGVLEAEQTKDPDNPARSSLRIQVLTQGQKRKNLPEGLVGSLLFRIGAAASPGSKVPVKIEKVKVFDMSIPSMELSGTAGADGSIEIVEEGSTVVVGCFFFTH
jgi:hypothetical protein